MHTQHSFELLGFGYDRAPEPKTRKTDRPFVRSCGKYPGVHGHVNAVIVLVGIENAPGVDVAHATPRRLVAVHWLRLLLLPTLRAAGVCGVSG